MVELPASARLVRMSNTLWSKGAIKTEFYEDSTRPGEIVVVLRPTVELTEPDVLVYWSQEQPVADLLPAQVALAGPFRADQVLALPAKSDLPGYLILFSLPHHMVVDSAKVEKLP